MVKRKAPLPLDDTRKIRKTTEKKPPSATKQQAPSRVQRDEGSTVEHANSEPSSSVGSVSHGSTKTRKVRSKKESFRTSSSGGPGVPDGNEDHSESDGLASRPKDDYVMVMSAFTPHINVAFDQAILARCNAIVLL